MTPAREEMSVTDNASRLFADHRERLFSMVYTHPRSVADTDTDTEDVVQDTWISWSMRSRPGRGGIDYPRAHLVRIAITQAIG